MRGATSNLPLAGALVLVFSALALGGEPTACATPTNVVTVSDVATLTQKIESGAETCIKLAAGVYDVSTSPMGNESGLVIVRDLALVGVGDVTLDAQGSTRVVEIRAPLGTSDKYDNSDTGVGALNVELHNLHLTGGSVVYPDVAYASSRGGCVLAHACTACVFVEMTEVHLSDCHQQCTVSRDVDTSQMWLVDNSVTQRNVRSMPRTARPADRLACRAAPPAAARRSVPTMGGAPSPSRGRTPTSRSATASSPTAARPWTMRALAAA